MLTGRVRVPVIESGGALVVPFKEEAVTLMGCKVADVTVGVTVGKGWTGGFPSVCNVVIIEPVVTAVLGRLLI